MPPRATSSCLVWLVSILPLAVPNAERWLAGCSRTAWCVLPWLVYAGLPEIARAGRRAGHATDELGELGEPAGAWGSWAFVALALPPTALALCIDRGAGLDTGAVSMLAALSLACAGVLRSSAAAGAGDARRGASYALAWIVLVPGLPFLCAALERGGAPAYGRVPSTLTVLSRASPLGWLAREMAELGSLGHPSVASAGSVLSSALLPACTTLVLFGLARRALLPRTRLETNP